MKRRCPVHNMTDCSPLLNGCSRLFTPARYDREVLMHVVNHHHKVEIKGCICGWAALGRTIGEHVADVYEESVRIKELG